MPREKILLPPLHIKLSLLKQVVKGLDSNSDGLSFIRKMFSKLYWAKIKGDIFKGTQIRVMLDSVKLEDVMTKAEQNAWHAFRMVAYFFGGTTKVRIIMN